MGQTTNFTDTVTWLKSLEKNRKVMLDYGEFDPFVYKNEATITREIDQFSDELFRQSKVKGMYSWQKEELPPLISMTSTFEDENLVLIQNRLLLRYFDGDKRNALNVFYYLSMENIIACSVSEFEAFERFNNGEFDFLVYKGPIANLTPAFIFDKAIGLPYYVYAKNTGSAKM